MGKYMYDYVNIINIMCIIYRVNKSTYRFAMFSFSLLVNSWSMKAFLKRLKLTFTLFSSPNIDETVQESFESLNQMFETLDCAAPTIKETTLDDASEDEGVTPIEADEIDVKINLDKPFN